MTHGEAYWCVRRRDEKTCRVDWLRLPDGSWDDWTKRCRFPDRYSAFQIKWARAHSNETYTLTVVRVTHRRKGT